MRKRASLIFLLAFVLAVPSIYAYAPDTKIQVRDINPRPAEPGDTVKIDLLVANEGDVEGNYVPIDVETVDGIKYRGTTSNFNEKFSLCTGCQMVGTLYLKVEENATSGTYPIDIVVSDGEVGIVEKATLEVDGTPNVVLTTPESNEVQLGEENKINLSLKNVGTDEASEIVASLQNDLVSIQPSQVVVKELAPGESTTEIVSLKIDEDLRSGIQKLRFSLTYKDESRSIQKNSTVSVTVLEKARLALSNLNIKSSVMGQSTGAIVEIENLGPGEAKTIESELSCEGADVSSSKAFVGQLDEDESVPMVFDLTPQSSQVNCDLTVNYIDSAERKVLQSFSFTAEGRAFPLGTVVVIILVAGGIIFYYWGKREGDEAEEI